MSNPLLPAYLVELWPYAQRSRGIGVQQFFGKLGGFFSTNVNSIALAAIKWKYLAIYCGWIFFEFLIVFFLYPETSGRTLEELAFRKLPSSSSTRWLTLPLTLPPQSSRTRISTKGPSLLSRSRSTLATALMLLTPNTPTDLPSSLSRTRSSCRDAERRLAWCEVVDVVFGLKPL